MRRRVIIQFLCLRLEAEDPKLMLERRDCAACMLSIGAGMEQKMMVGSIHPMDLFWARACPDKCKYHSQLVETSVDEDLTPSAEFLTMIKETSHFPMF